MPMVSERHLPCIANALALQTHCGARTAAKEKGKGVLEVPKCSSDAISILFGRAGANDLSQPRTERVFKNCPVRVASTQKD